MVEEIRQDGKVILSSEDVFSVPMIFNNLCGKNFIGKWKIQCKLPPKTKRFCPLVLK